LKFLKRVWPTLSNKRGAQTVEYVAVMAGAALLGIVLLTVMESEEIQSTLKEKVICVITQKCNENKVTSNKKTDDKSSGYIPSRVIPEGDDHLSDRNLMQNPASNDNVWNDSWEQTNDTRKSDQKPPTEDEGFFGMLKRKTEDAWGGFKEKATDAWEGTKEIASDTWNGIQSGAKAAWDWTVEHKEEIGAGLTVAAGVGLLFVPGGQALGAGILIGAAIGGGISAAQGNDLKTIMADTAVGGLAGAVGGGVTGGVVRGVGRYIGGKAAQLMGNPAGASAGTIADDLFHGRKINWKNAAAAGVLAFGITHGVQVAKTTSPLFGITPKSQQVQQATSSLREKVPKVRPASGDVNLDTVAKVRKELGLPSIADDVGKRKNTVAVLEADGKQIWGRSGWGRDVGGYDEIKLAWKGKINPISRTHAEADALFELYRLRLKSGITGGKATMAADRPPCTPCGQNKGIRSAVRNAGLDELELIYPGAPGGREIIRVKD
jgi:hypothetical protein